MAWAGEPRRRSGGRAALALAWLTFVLVSPAARADYKESYRKGIKAVDAKEWGEAARLMRAAAGEQPREGEQVKLYGVRFEPYLPSYYLGLALFEGGDCEAAVAAWQEAERRGAVQGSPRYKGLVEGRETCKQRLALRPPSAPLPAPRPPGPDPAEPARALQEAAAAVQSERQAEAPETHKAQAGESLARETREEEPRKRPDEAARGEAQRRVRAQDGSGPPAALRAAARAFFSADYAAVVSGLGGASFTEPKAAAARHLLLAAARYALFLAGGEKDARLRQQAVDHIHACRKINPKISPDGKAFSPRFRELFKSAG